MNTQEVIKIYSSEHDPVGLDAFLEQGKSIWPQSQWKEIDELIQDKDFIQWAQNEPDFQLSWILDGSKEYANELYKLYLSVTKAGSI